MLTLGINAAFHDSSACLARDGIVVAAAEEERFTGIKHAKRPLPFSAWELPFHAIDYCLAAADATISDIDHVAYSFDPYLLQRESEPPRSLRLALEPGARRLGDDSDPWEALRLAFIASAPRHLQGGVPHHLLGRLAAPARYRWHFVEHHQTHAASAFLPSPFAEAAVLTLDGRGERATTSFSFASGTRIERLAEVDMPNSLGLLYERFTEYLGFLHSSDEYKVMALASYGQPRFLAPMRELVQVEGSHYRVAQTDLEEIFGPPRARGQALEPRHFDIAASLQAVLEECVLQLAAWLHDATGARDLCLAGGVALNCVMNARLRDLGPFDRVWVQPAAGDAGTALGAALLVDAKERGDGQRLFEMRHAYLGPEYSEAEIEASLRSSLLRYERPNDLVGTVANILARGGIVGWFQGRMEFGPRALGSRSILASPIDVAMQSRLNELKDREDFRPVAPVVAEEDAANWFTTRTPSPFMLFVEQVRPDRAPLIPAACHVDGSARIQTVRRQQNPLLHTLLRRFGDETGVPVLINTSFNTRGRPIVCTPQDALQTFAASPLDALAIGPFLLRKASCLP